MSNTHPKDHQSFLSSVLHFATLSFLVAGIMMLVAASEEVLFAQQTSQGSNLLPSPTSEARLMQGKFHGAAFAENPVTNAAANLAIGSFLIFLGVAFHALIVIRSERPVRVIAGPSHKKTTPKIRIQTIYWMQILPRRK